MSHSSGKVNNKDDAAKAEETSVEGSTVETADVKTDSQPAPAVKEADIVDGASDDASIDHDDDNAAGADDYDDADETDDYDSPSGSPGARTPANVDLAESADRLMRLIAAENAAAGGARPADDDSDDGSDEVDGEAEMEAADAAPKEPAPAAAAPAAGLAGFLQWLTQTRQLGRRASRLLAAVESLRAPLERKQRMADLVRLSLLLECNSAIGFNADGTLRNTEAAARVWTAEDELEATATELQRVEAEISVAAAAADAADAAKAQTSPSNRRRVVTFKDAEGGDGGGDGDDADDQLRDDAEVLMAKEEIQGDGGNHGLLVFTGVCLAISVLASLSVPGPARWLADWLVLVTATAGSLMLGIGIFVRAGRRRRPIEAYREMSRELQNNRILISTIRHGG